MSGYPGSAYPGAPPQGYPGAPPQGYPGAPPQGYPGVNPQVYSKLLVTVDEVTKVPDFLYYTSCIGLEFLGMDFFLRYIR